MTDKYCGKYKIMKKILDFFRKADIPNPPWDYDFIYKLEDREYSKYLAKIFKLNTGEDVDLTPPSFRRGFRRDSACYSIDSHGSHELRNDYIKSFNNLKTFNQKIQWLKLYDVTPLKKLCTDKVTVRDYVRKKIGAEYLKPVLQIITKDKFYIYSHGRGGLEKTALNSYGSIEPQNGSIFYSNDENINMQSFDYPIECSSLFDKIDFDSLPDSFVMKCSHGCKWQYIIKNKEEFLSNKSFFGTVRQQMMGWLEQEFWAFGGFEMQYKGLEPKIIIEPLMRDNINEICPEIMIYCFSGCPKLTVCLHKENESTVYDENFNVNNNIFKNNEIKINAEADENVKLAFELSKELSKPFLFVRCDFMLYQNRLYFEELTFTPYSGFLKFKQNSIFNFWSFRKDR